MLRRTIKPAKFVREIDQICEIKQLVNEWTSMGSNPASGAVFFCVLVASCVAEWSTGVPEVTVKNM